MQLCYTILFACLDHLSIFICANITINTLMLLNTLCMLNCRRPFGIDKEFFVQLFVEPNKNEPAVDTQMLLNRMFQEQNITFTKVGIPTPNVYAYLVHSIQYDCFCKCLDMEKSLKVFSILYLHYNWMSNLSVYH